MKNKTLKRVLSYIKKDIGFLIGSIIFAIINVCLTLFIPIATGRAIDTMIIKGEVNPNTIPFKYYIFIILISVIVCALSQLIMSFFNNHLTYKVIRRIRIDAFNKLHELPISYLDSNRNGELISRIINDVDTFADGLLMGFTNLFIGIATILGTLIFMFIINWIIAICVLVVSPISILVARFITTKTHKLFTDQSIIKGEETALIEEMVNNLKTVKAYSHEDENNEKFNEINDHIQKVSFKATFYSSLTNPSTRFVNSIVYAVVCLFGALMCLPNSKLGILITPGILTIFLSYANQYTKPFNEISSVITELQNAFACCSRVFNLIDEKAEISDEGNKELVDANGDILIKDVAFSYNKETSLLTNFNLDVHKGETIAIVGPTGCGKTTFINLLMRFYDVDNGSISVDGHDIRTLTRHSLRHNYGMVLQDTWLKNDTVINNIKLGKKDATLEEIIEVCKKVHADSFIKRLPNGYDTVIKDDGMLSGGEKQLLCIARIMLVKPNILILDEATSNIDTRTEVLIDKAFKKLMENKTTFIVAHRLRTIKHADTIIVMNSGNIVEQGNHEELLNKKGFYYELYNSQFDKES